MQANIVFASLTGNNEEVAEIVQRQLDAQGVTTTLTEMSQADAEDLTDGDIAVIVPYTYGEGDLPEEGLDFFEDLLDTDLSGVVFGVAGSGDSWYGDDYCKAVTEFDQQLAQAGATRGAQPLFVDLRPDDDDEPRLAAFTQSLMTAIAKRA
ncbi:flavodoxin [Levilactobacillus koreensis JCM 16448]|uniref:Flavodoxin n=1 Tax=Levilactobacillus koreensis TaxID=637971 RepID=A0AAC8UV15_9LACO|nr:flavodoxin [Levilactobacillus koreensis]AKP64382.1 flavodoxin [Levilactobacillus koreensis]KRK88516.1 flavodoxin [Levilactobacillus koreensis JCM 16448]